MPKTKMDTDSGTNLPNTTPKKPVVKNEIIETTIEEFIESPEIVTLPAPFMYKDKLITKAYLQEVTGAVEEQYNTPQNKENYGRFITLVCSACVTQFNDIEKKSIHKEEWIKILRMMPMVNRDFILFAIYMLSEGNKMPLEDTICPSCDTKGFEINLSDQRIRYYKKAFIPVTYTLPRGYKDDEGSIFDTIQVNLPTGTTQEQTFNLFAKSPSKGESLMYATCIDEISNKGRSKIFNIDIARSLLKKDRTFIGERLADITPGMSVLAPIECSCGAKFNGLLSISDFFLT